MAMEYGFWTMRESTFHQLSDSQCIFLFAFVEVKIICAFVAFSADPTYFRFSLKQVIPEL
jgi:hypothetical protein